MSNCSLSYHHKNHDHPQLLQLKSSLPSLCDTDDNDGGGDDNDHNDDDRPSIVKRFCKKKNWTN